MKLRHIEVFHAIYNTGSMTKAAQLLFVSQPAVSKILQHAEQQLGFELFHRVKGNRLVPTENARILIQDCNKIYQQINSLQNTTENLKKNSGAYIAITALPALSLDLIPSAIEQFRSSSSQASFDIQTKHYDEAIQSLREYESQIALVFNHAPMSGINQIHIGNARLVCVTPKGYLQNKGATVDAETIAQQDIINIMDSGPLGKLLENKIGANAIQNAKIKVQTYYMAKRLVSYDQGIAIVDEITAKYNSPDNLDYYYFEPDICFSISALHLETNPLSKACSDFLDIIKLQYQRKYCD